MVDLGGLEKMGRELKCPICLSLLKSAVSLVCNHVFCNPCILESMKSVSDCPVCKVPFRRREIRPAPHMDNLVSIYKSMEAASGLNIFSTQTAPSTKCTDWPLQSNNKKNSDEKEAPIEVNGNLKCKRLVKRKQDLDEADARRSSGPAMMPSFPAKKRVHVRPHPLSETPIRSEKGTKLTNPSPLSEAGKLVNKNENKSIDKEGDVFSPFFWLRERNDDEEVEDSQKLTQQTAETSSGHIVPCFSDIKDSDDETYATCTPTSKPDLTEAFDSEMFEWTQRACSPELCSTPVKHQTSRHGPNLSGMSDKEWKEEDLQVVQNNEPIPLIGVKRKLTRKKKRSNAKIVRKLMKMSACETYGTALDETHPLLSLDYGEIAANSSHEDKDLEEDKPANPGMKKSRTKPPNHCQIKRPDNSLNHAAIVQASEHPSCNIAEVKNKNLEKSISRRAVNKESRSRRGQRRTNLQINREDNQTSEDNMADAVAVVQQNPGNDANIQDEDPQRRDINLIVLSCKQGENCETSSRKYPGRVDEIQKQQGKSKTLKHTIGQAESLSTTKSDDITPLASWKKSVNENNQTIINSSIRSTKRPRVSMLATSGTVLRKCENDTSNIRCFFCQSDNETEVSGDMMHYLNGKPVTVEYNGGLNIIHAHKNCTEWAPNVYFEDEIAINLAAELARSRRIKCSCCGIKGAALGCFDKNCRKSFHYTCAKSTPECRWDHGNFVMLCPLHSSSKLPNEFSESERKCRKRNAPKIFREPQELSMHKPCHGTDPIWKWPSGPPCKWLLCCSALTNTEKEIMAKFTKLVDVPISKVWKPSVTHVIASADENGACKRTLKFLMGIIDGKWILSIDWIKACMEAMEPVDEENYEIKVDVNGILDGPRLGRLRATNEQPKLFAGFRFYFNGDFVLSYKRYLQDLLVAAGGIVLQRKPIPMDEDKLLMTFIIYSSELPEKHHGNRDAVIARRHNEAKALADATGAKLVSNSWIIDSIAACKLQLLV